MPSPTRADHTAGRAIEEVVEVHLPLDRDHARQCRGVDAVEILPHQRGLDHLQVFGQIVDRAADQTVRHQDRRANRERHVVPRLVVQDVRAVEMADAATLGDAVAVVVHIHTFMVDDRAQGRVGRINAGRRLEVLEAVVHLAVCVELAFAGILLDDVAVVAHRHKLDTVIDVRCATK